MVETGLLGVDGPLVPAMINVGCWPKRERADKEN